MVISEDTIEKIRLSNSIDSVIREYLPDLKRAGRNWKVCCPFHNEKTPSFIVSPEKGIFKCFSCNVAGDVFKFVMFLDNISWIEAVKKLAKKTNIEIQEAKQGIIKLSENTKLFDILESSANFYNKCLLERASAQKAREYIKKRGINREAVNKFKIGFAPKGQFLQWALEKDYKDDDLLKAGLITRTGRGIFFECMSERVVFPIFDVQGRIVAFGGRTIADHKIKYLNTPETAVYSKSSNLYGLFQTLPELRKERKIIVLEGYIDAVILQQFGITGAVATLGTAFTQNHAKLVSRYSDSVTLLFDSDNAGRTAAQRSLEILVGDGSDYVGISSEVAAQRSLEILVGDSIECRVSALPEHVDADEYLNQYGKESFLKFLEDSSKSAIDFMIERVLGGLSSDGRKSSPEIKAKAVSALLDFVARSTARSTNSIIQREWIRDIAQHVDVNEEAVWREFGKKQQLRLRGRGYLQYDKNSVEQTVKVKKDKKFSMSLEENLLNLILNNRDYIKKTDSNCFEDARCRKIFELTVSGLNTVGILNTLSEEDKNWFAELILNTIEYSDIGEAFDTILRDIDAGRLERERRRLEKEILLVSEGKKEKDKKVFDEYKKLTALLKGSGK
ncbi:DNA primase [Endomicrobiia bacterium]|nr:DNA primase [Endomicrobiia bacterium]GHT21114.1 DNA primase [Endomicrobiia bacterium]GHT28629.1 DNA primase [Endomicrobiia bacterium]GHT31883.1 DNA primase [Endomicrobiia bacterium]